MTGTGTNLPAPAAVLFDRDDTLVQDVPYNDDPAAVRPVPGARAALLSGWALSGWALSG